MSRNYVIENADANRRDSHRMPALDECSEGRLRVGRKWLECEIQDVSTGGFLISLKNPMPRNATHKLLVLQADGAHFPVRLAWHRKEGRETRVGLQRLQEDMPSFRKSGHLLWFTAAIIVGFGFGYVYANGRLADLPMLNRSSGVNPYATSELDPSDGQAIPAAIPSEAAN